MARQRFVGLLQGRLSAIALTENCDDEPPLDPLHGWPVARRGAAASGVGG
jgi:hypothetical protein